MALRFSSKHFQIDKANNYIMLVAAVACVITVFSLVSVKSLWSQSSYQRKVLKEKKKAVDQLQKNLDAIKVLKTQYQVFATEDPNILGGKGGTSPGTGPIDGDNSRIVLDALPSQYDFPALISSIEKIVVNEHLTTQAISGTDEGDTQASADSSAPIELKFNIETLNNYAGAQTLLKDFERSIRPIDVNKLELAGSVDNMHASVEATTYYQPAMKFEVQQKAVK